MVTTGKTFTNFNLIQPAAETWKVALWRSHSLFPVCCLVYRHGWVRREKIIFLRKAFFVQWDTMKFENILANINGFGRFQIMIIVISFIGRFTMPCHFFLNNFIAAVPSHHCNISSLDDGGSFRNLSQEKKLIISIPFEEDGTPNSCKMFAELQYHLLTNSSNITNVPTVPCRDGWIYDNTTFNSTLTSQVTFSIFLSFVTWNNVKHICSLPWAHFPFSLLYIQVGSGVWSTREKQGNCYHLLCWSDVWSRVLWNPKWQVSQFGYLTL